MSTPKKSSTPLLSDDEKHSEFLKQFAKQDDRSAVILAAALIELHLGALLKKALLPSPVTKDALLDERGPLSTLYSRSHLCLRLGLIDTELFRAIDFFRDIRNIYAHQLQYSDLSAEPYSAKIAEIYKLISWYEPFAKMTAIAFGTDKPGAMHFKAVAALVVIRLKQAVDEQISLAASEARSLVSVKWEVARAGMRARGEVA
jgi:DNA-binding MltR family transcriptional regulator